MALGVTDSARSPVTFAGPRARTPWLVVRRHRSKYLNALMVWWHRPAVQAA